MPAIVDIGTLIERSPEIRKGRPCIAGTGVSQTLAAARNRKIYVAGGLFLAIEYAAVARGGRAQDLRFF